MTLFYNALAFFAPLAVDKFESSLLPHTEELQRRCITVGFDFVYCQITKITRLQITKIAS